MAKNLAYFGRLLVWGCFSWFLLEPVVSVERNLNATVDNVATVCVWPFLVSKCKSLGAQKKTDRDISFKRGRKRENGRETKCDSVLLRWKNLLFKNLTLKKYT